MEQKLYKLIGPDGEVYLSPGKGLLGGYKRHHKVDNYYGKSNKNVYGRMDCPIAKRALAAPTHESYESHRVFFKDEDDAIAAGFRPCSRCLPEKYAAWASGKDPRTAPFPKEYYGYKI